MFPQAQKDDLPDQISYISAIGKRQIKTLLKNEQLQMSLFDEDLQEVEIDQVRYILRCNSHRKQELAGNRADKIKFISTKIEEKNTYLQEVHCCIRLKTIDQLTDTGKHIKEIQTKITARHHQRKSQQSPNRQVDILIPWP